MTTNAPIWPPQLVLDIALEAHSVEELLVKYSLDKEDLDHFYSLPQFVRELIQMRSELTSSGSSFRAHARVMAEEHLMTMNELMHDRDVPSTIKVQLWQSLVRYASLEPPKESTSGGGGAITINIAGYAAAPAQQPRPIIDITTEPKCLP